MESKASVLFHGKTFYEDEPCPDCGNAHGSFLGTVARAPSGGPLWGRFECLKCYCQWTTPPREAEEPKEE